MDKKFAEQIEIAEKEALNALFEDNDKFKISRERDSIPIDFTLKDIQEYAENNSTPENRETAIQFMTDSYMRELESLQNKVAKALENNKLTEDISIEEYTSYAESMAELEGLSEEQSRKAMTDAVMSYGKYKSNNSDPER